MARRILLLCVWLLAIFSSNTVSYAQGVSRPTRIMCLGDSVTRATAQRNSFRRPLWQFLEQNKFRVDFVGSDTSNKGGPPPNPDFDLNHEGHTGYRTDLILAELPDYLAQNMPDYVLIHLGTNDIAQGRDPFSAATNVASIVAVMRAANPKMTFLVAQIIPMVGKEGVVRVFNQQLVLRLKNASTAQSKVIIVDQYTGFNANTETGDGVHPNAKGELRIAQKWWDVLRTMLDPRGYRTSMAPMSTPFPIGRFRPEKSTVAARIDVPASTAGLAKRGV